MSQTSQRIGIGGAWITGPALWALACARVAQWDRRARDPARAQTATLLAHCRAARTTAFGREHDLGRVRSHAEFVERVPLRDYDAFDPWLARMRRGERDVLWPGLVRHFVKSAGSSRREGSFKYLPLSELQIGLQAKQAFDVLARYLSDSGDRTITGGFALGLLPPPTVEWDGPVGTTNNPGFTQSRMPSLSQRFALPRPAIRDIDNYERKFESIAANYLDHDVRAVAGTTCWFGALFDRVLAAAHKRGSSATTVCEIWPDLRVLFGGGVNAKPYRAMLTARLGRPVWLVDNYNASEGGALAVSDRDGDLLMIPDRGVFFEFVPRADFGRPGARRLPLAQVERDVDYAIAVTTPSGLFGYVLGDVVRFSTIAPHRLIFCGRLGGEISITHEKTTQRNIEDAVQRVALRQGCTVAEFAAAGDVRELDTSRGGTSFGRYQLFVEFATRPADLDAFAREVDAEIAVENYTYGLHRSNELALLPLELVPLQIGTATRFCEAAKRRGWQQKFPRILDESQRNLLRGLASPQSAAHPETD